MINILMLGSKKYRHLHSFRLCAVSSPWIINDHPCIISLHQVVLQLKKSIGKSAFHCRKDKTEQYVLINSVVSVINDEGISAIKGSVLAQPSSYLCLLETVIWRALWVLSDVLDIAEAYLYLASH